MAPEVGLEPTTLRLTAACSTIELLWNWKWLPRKDSHLHKNVNSVPCYFDTTREFKKMFTGFQRTFHLLIITSSDYNIQCLSVSIHYLLLQLVIQIRTEWFPLIRAVVLPIKLRSLPSPNVFEKMASTVRIELTHGLLESLSPNPWNIGGY